MPESIGGYYANGQLHWALKIPDGLSLLLHLTPNGYVTGLSSAPPADRPSLVTVVHLAFDTMVGLGFGLLLLGAWLALAWWRHRAAPRSVWFLRATAVSGVAAVVAMESGWIVTEVGRQPWIVYGVLRVSDAVNPAPGLGLGAGGRGRGVRRAVGSDRVRAAAAGPQPPGAGRAAGERRHWVQGGLTMATTLLALMWASVTVYALLAGADFGAGAWDLLSGRTGPGARRRALIEHAIGPVWEANHVWLIFVLVLMWTAFPPAVRRGVVDPVHPADPGGAGGHRPGLGLRVPQGGHRGGGSSGSSGPRSRSPRWSRRSSWARWPAGWRPAGSRPGWPAGTW